MSYRVFKRRPYRRERLRYVPNPGAHCTVIRRNIATIDEARAICAQGPANIALDQGREYRGLMFYEFTKEG